MYAKQLGAKLFGDLATSSLLLLVQENHLGVTVFLFLCLANKLKH